MALEQAGEVAAPMSTPEPAALAQTTGSIQVRSLLDTTLLVVLSDTHIGGDPGFDIFESPGELVALFNELDAHAGPVELVLAGDFFDFLRIGSVPPGANRASLTIARPEYRELFAALRRFAAAGDHHVVYLPGNHDAELWWNADIQKTLRTEGLVDEIALSYSACFASRPDQLIYCEHGNEFDPDNAIRDYSDALDTPLGTHIVTDVIPRIVPGGRNTSRIDLRDVNFVFPVLAITDWLAGRLFYALLRQSIVYVFLPLLVAYIAFEAISSGLTSGQNAGTRGQQSTSIAPWFPRLLVEIGYDALLLLTTCILFFALVRWMMGRLRPSTGTPEMAQAHDRTLDAASAQLKQLLTSDRSPPLGRSIAGRQIGIFISGHTHAPALGSLQRGAESPATLINSGCWLRQLQPVTAHLRGPPVFAPVFVLTHVRLTCVASRVRAELWEQPRAAPYTLRFVERLAIWGRRPVPPTPNAAPRVRVRADV